MGEIPRTVLRHSMMSKDLVRWTPVEADALARRIREAFAGVDRPSANAMTPHRCEECDELRDSLVGLPVSSPSIDVLEKHVWDLPLLSAEAKHYFLPAWLCAALSNPTGDFADAARTDINSNHRYDPVGGYTDEQWRVILDWLDFVAAAEEDRS